MKINTSRAALVVLASVVAASVSGCIPMGPVGTIGNPQQQTPLPTFTVTTHNNTTETVSTNFTPGVGATPGRVRVCLNNQRPGNRAINLNLQGVNPMVGNGRNTQSCVSVGANQTVNLLAAAGNQPAFISPNTLNLAPYDGGLLTLVWN